MYQYFIVIGDVLESWGRWHRTKELIEGFYPYGGWYGGKKWHDFDVGIKCTINKF